MSTPVAKQPSRSRSRAAALVCAVAGLALFTFFGSAARGYVNSPSLVWWWVSQWLDPAAETQHGWLILGASVWLGWLAVRSSGTGVRAADGPSQAAALGDTAPRPDDQAGLHARGVRPGSPGIEATLPAPRWESTTPAWVALAFALALHAVGFAAQQARVSLVALLVFIWAVIRLAGGRRAGERAIFPLAFMLFAMPISLLDEVGLPLRLWVTEAGERIAHGLGIGVLRSGTQLMAPDGRFHYDVAAPCSGVRSLVALTALSLLFGYLGFASFSRRALVVLSSLPLIFVGNVVRIVSIVLAAQWGGPVWGERMHAVMGYGVFVIVLAGVIGVAALLRRFWPEHATVNPHDDGSSTGNVSSEFARRGRASRGVIVATAIFVGAVAVEMAWLHWLVTARPAGWAGVVLAADGVNPVDLPAFVGTEWIGQRTDVTDLERAVLPADTGFSRKRYANVADRRADVFLSIVLSGRDRTSIHRPELCLVGQGWTIEGRTRAMFRGADGQRFEATVLQVRREVMTARGRVTVPQCVVYWYIGGREVVASHGARFVQDTWNRVIEGRADRWAYVLMQTDASDGEAAALSRMQVILDGTLPVFERRVVRAASK